MNHPRHAPLTGPNAFSAAEILKLHRAPLFSVDGVAFNAGVLDIAGLALAPGGDASAVRPVLDPDVVFEWQYPMPTPGAVDHYWYWPNAERCGYRLRLNVAASRDMGAAFRVCLVFAGPQSKHEAVRNTIFVPKDLRRYQNYPSQSQLARVQYYDNIGSVVVNGYSDYRRIRALAESYGVDLTRARVLDWGCGHGRVIRHFDEVGPNMELHGVDIDGENAAWAAQHLPRVRAIHGPLMPPLRYAMGTFDLVYGISVMTHLTESVQKAWVEELERIIRPGGLALLTFAGDTDVAFTSCWLDRAYVEEYIRTGRGKDLPATELVGKIDDPNYYRNVKTSSRIVRKLCEPYFEVLDVLECAFGYQDLAVLKRH
jgi:SAM-dependent methyltransferase